MRKKQIIKIILIFFLLTINFLWAQKKVVIELYDDGTWAKVQEIPENVYTKTIEETFTQFKKAVKDKNSDKILSFFIFPFDILILISETDPNTSERDKCIRPVCQLNGAVSKSKLKEKLSILFDNNFNDIVSKIKSDEYTEKHSTKYNRKTWKYVGSIETQYFDSYSVRKTGQLEYTINFVFEKNEYNINNILIILKT